MTITAHQLDELEQMATQFRALHQGDVAANASNIIAARAQHAGKISDLHNAALADARFAPDTPDGDEMDRRLRQMRQGISEIQVKWRHEQMIADPDAYRAASRKLGQINAELFAWIRQRI